MSVPGKSRTLRVAEVLRVKSLGHFSSAGGKGVRIVFRGKHREEAVDFLSGSAQQQILALLARAGFNVVEAKRS